jgi:site-specific DNA-methyltransferase (adenine-specific)
VTCSRKIGPYDCCSVVEGDCLELMKSLPDGCVDAVITDPPYGIDYNPSSYKRWDGSASRFQSRIVGDDKPFDPSPWLRFPVVVLWGANNYAGELPRGAWYCWDKRCGLSGDKMFGAPFELAWTNSGTYGIARILHGGVINADSQNGNNELRHHPTQKPVALMAWCIEKAGNPETILDPYCGSGSTLIAAKKLGRHFLGFEISPEYCAIARKRTAAVEAQPNLFTPRPEQLTIPDALRSQGESK